MRIIMLASFLVLFFIITIPLLLVGYIVGKFSKNTQYKYAKFFLTICAKGIIGSTGSNITVTGMENIPKDQTVLFVGNHKSQLDIPLLIRTLDRPIGFVAKKELLKVPLLNRWMTLMGCLFLDRDDPRQAMQTMIDGINNLKNGHSMVIFPEGTRSKTDDLLPFKQGSLKLADKADVPIIPIGIKGTSDVLENNNYLVKRKPISIIIGEPILLSELSREERKKSSSYVQSIIEDLLK